jgi:hypothetical protein
VCVLFVRRRFNFAGRLPGDFSIFPEKKIFANIHYLHKQVFLNHKIDNFTLPKPNGSTNG